MSDGAIGEGVSMTLISELAPRGVLRVGVNLSNFLLVSGENEDGEPSGVSPDVGRAIARELKVPVEFVTFPGPGEAADAATDDIWDIVNIAAEAERARHIAFSDAYCEIQATCLLPADSPVTAFAELDAPGRRIAVKARSAYDLWLSANLRHATLVRAPSIDVSFERFVDESLDALAGLRPKLLEQQAMLPGSTVLDESFTAVRQSIGCRPDRPAASDFLRDFVRRAVMPEGLIESLIARHGLAGRLSVPMARASVT